MNFSKNKVRAVFLDKDGTLVDNVPYNIDLAQVRLCHGVAEGLRHLQQQGYRLFIVTNQSGVARGLFPESALAPMFSHLRQMLAVEGATIDACYYCPHHNDGVIAEYAISCNCRKPLPGMLQRASREHDIDLAASWMIGDILHDVECGRRAGCRTILIDNGNETEWLASPLRIPDFIAPNMLAAAAMICDSADAYHVAPATSSS